MSSPSAAVRSAIVIGLLASAVTAAQAARFQDLHDFTGVEDGREPSGGLALMNALLYGTTSVGGTSDAGAIYILDPTTNQEKLLYSFVGQFGGKVDGSQPVGEVAGVDGWLYGTTSFGGEFGGGTIFRFSPKTGVETIIHSFGSGTDGVLPAAGLIAVGKRLFGTTSQGGATGRGIAFVFNLGTMKETVLHEFQGGADGSGPSAPLTAANGLLYGTTYFGGPDNRGTVFRIDPETKTETVLHAFTGASFSGNPAAGLVYKDGFLYGTTSHGGRPHCSGNGCGTVFRVDASSGKQKVLYRFRSNPDGFDPEGGLVLDQGTLYGTTVNGGTGKSGTLFSVDIATGAKTTLHNFKFPTGANPGTLVETGGSLYGATHSGGGSAEGTVFEYTP